MRATLARLRAVLEPVVSGACVLIQ